MRKDYILDTITHAKVYGVCNNGSEIEFTFMFKDNTPSLSYSVDYASGAELNLKAKIDTMTLTEVASRIEDFEEETSEALDDFLEQFIKERYA